VKGTTVAVIAAICAVLGFALGFWPQYQQRTATEALLADMTSQAETLRGQLSQSADRVRMSDLLAQYLVIKDVVTDKNFGRAQELSTAWFDAIRAESQRTPNAEFRQALDTVLSFRDPVTMALTRGDLGALGQMTGIEDALRAALGFPSVRIAPETLAAAPTAPMGLAPAR
jgi:hypothetical protein